MTIMASGLGAQAPELELGVLGPFRARVAGEWLSPSTRQVARVATILAGWPGEPVERDRLVVGVWGEKPPTTVTNTLQVHVSHLRRMIGKHTVRIQGTGYILDVAPEAIDAEQLVEAIHEAARMRRREHYARAAELLTSATKLWRGTPFPDITDPDLEARRARLAELKDQAREDLLECRLELCRDRYELAEVIAEAKELISRQPLREKGHVILVRALAAADRPGEASAAFEQAAERMRSTMGLDPGRDLVEVHARSLTNHDSLLPRAMRRVTVLPEVDVVDEAAARIAEQVREAVVDLGARLVTVQVDGDEAARQALAVVIAHGLEPDMPTGVRMLDTAAPERILGTVDIVTGKVTSAQAALATRGSASALVALAPKPLGLDHEVVIDGNGRSDDEAASAQERRGA